MRAQGKSNHKKTNQRRQTNNIRAVGEQLGRPARLQLREREREEELGHGGGGGAWG